MSGEHAFLRFKPFPAAWTPPLVITAWGQDSTWHRISVGHFLGDRPLFSTELLLMRKYEGNHLGKAWWQTCSLVGTLPWWWGLLHVQIAELNYDVLLFLETDRKDDLPHRNNEDLHSSLNSGHWLPLAPPKLYPTGIMSPEIREKMKFILTWTKEVISSCRVESLLLGYRDLQQQVAGRGKSWANEVALGNWC